MCTVKISALAYVKILNLCSSGSDIYNMYNPFKPNIVLIW